MMGIRRLAGTAGGPAASGGSRPAARRTLHPLRGIWAALPACLAVVICATLTDTAFGGAAEAPFDVDSLDRKIVRTGEHRFVYVTYQDVEYREIRSDDMANPALDGQFVCLECKLAENAAADEKGKRILHIMEAQKVKIIAPENAVPKGAIRGDRIWVAGKAKKAAEGPGCDLEASHIYKLKRDLERFKDKVAALTRQGDAEGLISIWGEVEHALKTNPAGFGEFQDMEQIRRRALRAGLELKAKSLAPNDADGRFWIAREYYEKLRKQDHARVYIEEALKIDPRHKGAAELASKEKWLEMFEGRWLRPEEIAKMLEDRKRISAEAAAEAERREKERAARLAMAVKERPLLLRRSIEKLYAADAKPPGAAAEDLAAAGRDTEDDWLARRAALLICAAGVPAAPKLISELAASKLPAARAAAYEALCWLAIPGGRSGEEALAALAKAIENDEDQTSVGVGIDAIASLRSEAAVETLVTLADAENEKAAEEASKALSTITGVPFADRKLWGKWWTENKDKGIKLVPKPRPGWE
ncbi:MAG: hypothetical protein N3A38_01240 [Planctomycetota bacterium]|nr:hypothetical protein [Planctomycetota bacterium]